MTSRSSAVEKNKYLFIDGHSLQCVFQDISKGLFSGEPLKVNFARLSWEYQKVFYYDCLPAQKDGEDDADFKERIDRKQELFNELKALDGFHVYEGTARYRRRHKRQEQKQVDIMIAVDMLTHSFKRNMNEATLITGDLDFKPLVDALVQDGMYVSLLYPKGRTNYELVDAADSRKPLTVDNIKRWLATEWSGKYRIPKVLSLSSDSLDFGWKYIKKRDGNGYSAHFHKKQSEFRAVVSRIGKSGSCQVEHDNLEQLEFYIEHIYSPNVLR